MGDQGRLYVHEDVVPAYKKLVHDADLILPNQFELECETIHLLTSYVMADLANGEPSRLLSDIKITSLQTLVEAIESEEGISIATLMVPIVKPADIMDPNIVKVVLDFDGNALYFSRAPIPSAISRN